MECRHEPRAVLSRCHIDERFGAAQSESTPKPPQPQSPPPLDGPTTDLAPIPSGAELPQTGSSTDEDGGRITTRETVPYPGELADSSRVRVRKAPPPSVVERPSGPRPDRRAQWIAGHWDWDALSDDFVWVGGSWKIPPAGSTWVAGRWQHDAAGWYWVSGTWSRPRDRSTAAANTPAWRMTGPPEDHPDDTPPPAPGTNFFFVPGHFAPSAGDRLAWTSGFWARVQPGWDWIPARWVRRANGWDFREGRWVRDSDTAVVKSGPRGRRRLVARPLFPGRRPEVVESEPGVDRLPLPPGPVTERDPIAEAEAVRPSCSSRRRSRDHRWAGRSHALLRHPPTRSLPVWSKWSRAPGSRSSVRASPSGSCPTVMADESLELEQGSSVCLGVLIC